MMKLRLYRSAKAITTTKRLYGVSTTPHKDEYPAVLLFYFTPFVVERDVVFHLSLAPATQNPQVSDF
jgi:hypothetical protein